MVQVKLLANTGHQYFFSGVVAAAADVTAFHNARLNDPRDLGPREIGNVTPLLDASELVGLIAREARNSPWRAVKGAAHIRYRLGARNYLNKQGSEYSINGIWFAIETNIGTKKRGYVVGDEPNNGGDLEHNAAAQAAVPPYAAPDRASLPTTTVPVTVTFGPEVDVKIPASYRTLAIIWQKPAGPPVDVDLIIDFGNTRTAVFALEKREDIADQVLDFQRICRPIGFMHAHDRAIEIPSPSRGNAEPFLVDSWFVFHETNFAAMEGADARLVELVPETVTERGLIFQKKVTRVGRVVSRMPHAFAEQSPVALGPWAGQLLSGAPTTGGRLFMSSPKRYAWDDAPSIGQGSYWTMILNQWSTHDYERSLPPLRGEVLRFVYANDRPWKIENPPTLDKPIYRPVPNPPAPFHARGCTMTLAALAILESAYRQITSYEWRRDYEEFLPRTLRTIQVTYPSGWTTDEINAYQSKWQNAINIFAHTRIPLRPDNGAASDPEIPVPQLKMTIDEAVAAQLPIVYTQIRNLRNDGDVWARLYGRPDAQGRHTVRVMSIDIGGGTTDTSIVEYRNDATVGNVRLNAKLIFRDSSTMAGDRLAKTIIEKVLLPSLGQTLLASGNEPGMKDKFRNLFARAAGNDREREDRAIVARLVFMPLVVKWLQDLSAERRGAPGGGFWSWGAAGCDVNGIERLHRILDSSLINLVLDTNAGFQINYDTLEAAASEVFRSLVSLHAQLVAAYDCDLIVMTGKPSELPQVRALFEERLPLPANRIVSAKGYHTQDWFPLTADGTIPDAKLVTAVGAALARAIDRKGVAGWDPIVFDAGYEQRYCWGQMPPDEGPFASRHLLIADSEEFDVKDGKLVVLKSTRQEERVCELSTDTTYIGRHLFRAEGRPEQIYQLRRRQPAQRAAAQDHLADGSVKVTIRLRRETEQAENALGITERLIVDEVLEGEDSDGMPLTTNDVELKLCTLLGRTHWLDTGQFFMEWGVP